VAFSTSGVLLKPLIDAGWSPAGAVALRCALASVVLAIPALVALQGDLRPLLRAWRIVLAYGFIAVAGTQVLYFAAIQRLPIAVALLIQYSAPVMITLLGWATGRARIRPVVVLGVVSSVAGLLFVVGIDGFLGVVDGTGIALALASAVCLAGYYLLSARPTPGLPPLTMVAAGLLIGALVTALVGLAGILPWQANALDVRLGAATLPWWVPMVLVALVATAAAYSLSIAGSRRLGSRLAAFAGLTEVVFAVALAWLLLGEQPGWRQLVGGVAILLGVILVGRDQPAGAPGETPAPLEPAGLPPVDPLDDPVDDDRDPPVGPSTREGRR
jgi:drug/metabolite transporter (DMT)-like permease